MKFNILIGGSAGQGVETTASLLEALLKRKGLEIFTSRDYMSRIRGGHNFMQVRFGDETIHTHSDELDGIVAMDEDTVSLHTDRLKKDGFVIGGHTESKEQSIAMDIHALAKEVGNARVAGTVAIGAVLKLFGVELEGSEKTLETFFSEKLLGVNMEALKKGYASVEQRQSISSKEDKNRYLINGNEAIALGALAAGVKFYSAYPMTPSTSIMNYICTKMEEAKVVVEQAEDEIAGINMAIGASYAGVRSMTGTSGGGFCLKVEALGLAGMQEIPLVIANIQRPGPATGLPTRTEQSDLKFIVSASHGEFPRMVLAVRDPEDAFTQTVRAFNLADKYQLPVIILGDQYHADSTTTVEAFDFSKVTIEKHLADPKAYQDREYKRYALTENGVSDRLIPGRTCGSLVLVDSDEHDEYGKITESSEVRNQMVHKRLAKMKALEQDLQEPRFFGDENCETLLVGWGSTQGALKEAVETLTAKGESVAALCYGDIYPLPVKLYKKYTKIAKTVINVEQNATGQLGGMLVENTGIFPHRSILKYDGRQISGEEIVNQVLGGES